MRILQIMNRVPWPLKDGGALGYYNYTKGYYDAGCDLTVAALNTSKHFVQMDELPTEVKQLADWRTSYVDNRVKPVDAFLNLFSDKSYNIQRFISPAFEQLLIDLLHEKTFDVIIFESMFVAYYMDIARKHSNALVILRQHNVEYKVWETLAQNETKPWKKWYLQLLTERLKKFEHSQLNKADALTTVTENDKNDFIKMGCMKPILSAPSGIDISRLKVDHSNVEVPSVFHLGSMEWLPNQEAIRWFVEQVWNHIAAKHPSLTFYIAGRGMPESFKQLSGKNIQVIGEVENAITFMQSKQIMIVPLFAGSGIRVKILEGMALGKSIITTSLGAQGIEYENGRHLLIANTAKEFIEAIDKLILTPQLAIDLGTHAKALIDEKYDNTKVIAHVLRFYKEQIEAIHSPEYGI
jgi:glycosyltransferase involved in cell wall biosynthesis